MTVWQGHVNDNLIVFWDSNTYQEEVVFECIDCDDPVLNDWCDNFKRISKFSKSFGHLKVVHDFFLRSHTTFRDRDGCSGASMMDSRFES